MLVTGDWYYIFCLEDKTYWALNIVKVKLLKAACPKVPRKDQEKH